MFSLSSYYQLNAKIYNIFKPDSTFYTQILYFSNYCLTLSLSFSKINNLIYSWIQTVFDLQTSLEIKNIFKPRICYHISET